MKLLSIEALGGNRYRATFDEGVHDVEVDEYRNGIRGASGASFSAMLNRPFKDWDEKAAISREVNLMINEALALKGVGRVSFS